MDVVDFVARMENINKIICWIRSQPMPEMEYDSKYVIPEFWRKFCYLDEGMNFHWREKDKIFASCSLEELNEAVGELIKQCLDRHRIEMNQVIEISGLMSEVLQ